MPERSAIRAGLRQEIRRRVYGNDCDDDHKTITLLVTNADQIVIASPGRRVSRRGAELFASRRSRRGALCVPAGPPSTLLRTRGPTEHALAYPRARARSCVPGPTEHALAYPGAHRARSCVPRGPPSTLLRTPGPTEHALAYPGAHRALGPLAGAGSRAEPGDAPGPFGKMIFLLELIRQSVSGCPNPREQPPGRFGSGALWGFPADSPLTPTHLSH